MLPATAVLSGTGSPVARLVDKLRLCALSLARKLGNFLEMPKFPISKFGPFSAVSVQSFAKKYAAAACVPGQDVDAKLVPRQGPPGPWSRCPGPERCRARRTGSTHLGTDVLAASSLDRILPSPLFGFFCAEFRAEIRDEQSARSTMNDSRTK